MSTLTYTHEVHAPTVPADAKPARKPFWSRLFHAIAEGQQRRADREVARYLASHGHLLNDAAEREIMRRLWRAGGTPL
jgi:DNA-binding FadR family transcriptional regulator